MQARTKGIVIKRAKVSSADVLLKLFTRDYGVLKFYVNGARHPKSRLAAFTQLFSEGNYDVYLKSSLSNITSAELLDAHQPIVDDYEKFLYGSFFLELIDVLTPDAEADPKLYDFFSAALKAFEAEEAHGHLKFKCFFILKLLKRLGYAPVMDRCSACSVKGDFSHFSVRSGGRLCPSCLGLYPDNITVPEDLLAFIKYSLEKPYALLPNFAINATMYSMLDELLFSFIYRNVSPVQLKTNELLKTL